jgi:hypothetical protein
MITIIYTNKFTIMSLLNIHHAYMFRPNGASAGHWVGTMVVDWVGGVL